MGGGVVDGCAYLVLGAVLGGAGRAGGGRRRRGLWRRWPGWPCSRRSAARWSPHSPDESDREGVPRCFTFLVAASGVAVLGIRAAFWALIAGLVVRFVMHVGRRR